MSVEELEGIQFDVELDSVRAKAELARLAKLAESAFRVTLNVDTSKARAAIGSLSRDDVRVGVNLDTSRVKSDLAAFRRSATDDLRISIVGDSTRLRSELDRIKATSADLRADLNLDASEARRHVAELKAELVRLTANVDVDDSAARARVNELKAELRTLKAQLDLDTSTARAQLALLDRHKVTIEADLDTDSVRSRLSNEGQAVGQAFGVAIAAGAAAALAAAPALGVAAGGVVLGAKGAGDFADFQVTLAEVNALTKPTAKQMAELRKEFIALGNSALLPKVTAEGAAESYLALTKRGLSAADAQEALNGTFLAATATGADNAEAVDLVATALNLFKREGEDANKVADAATLASLRYGVSLQDLNDSLKAGAGAYAATNESLEEYIALTALASKLSGQSGATIGTALKTALQRVAKGGGEAGKGLKSLGIEVNDANGNFIGMVELLEQVKQATQDLGTGERAKVLAQIFGARSSGAPGVLAQLDPGVLRAAVDEIENLGISAQIAQARTEGLRGALDTLQSSIETGLLELGGKVSSSLDSIIRDGLLKPTEIKFKVKFEDGSVGQIVEESTRLQRIFDNISTGIGRGFADARPYAEDFFAFVEAKSGDVGPFIQDAIRSGFKLAVSGTELLGSILTPALLGASNDFVDRLADSLKQLSGFGPALGNVFAGVVEAGAGVLDLINGVLGLANKLPDSVKEFTIAWRLASAAVGVVMPVIQNLVSLVGGASFGKLEEGVRGVGKAASGAASGVGALGGAFTVLATLGLTALILHLQRSAEEKRKLAEAARVLTKDLVILNDEAGKFAGIKLGGALGNFESVVKLLSKGGGLEGVGDLLKGSAVSAKDFGEALEGSAPAARKVLEAIGDSKGVKLTSEELDNLVRAFGRVGTEGPKAFKEYGKALDSIRDQQKVGIATLFSEDETKARQDIAGLLERSGKVLQEAIANKQLEQQFKVKVGFSYEVDPSSGQASADLAALEASIRQRVTEQLDEAERNSVFQLSAQLGLDLKLSQTDVEKLNTDQIRATYQARFEEEFSKPFSLNLSVELGEFFGQENDQSIAKFGEVVRERLTKEIAFIKQTIELQTKGFGDLALEALRLGPEVGADFINELFPEGKFNEAGAKAARQVLDGIKSQQGEIRSLVSQFGTEALAGFTNTTIAQQLKLTEADIPVLVERAKTAATQLASAFNSAFNSDSSKIRLQLDEAAVSDINTRIKALAETFSFDVKVDPSRARANLEAGLAELFASLPEDQRKILIEAGIKEGDFVTQLIASITGIPPAEVPVKPGELPPPGPYAGPPIDIPARINAASDDEKERFKQLIGTIDLQARLKDLPQSEIDAFVAYITAAMPPITPPVAAPATPVPWNPDADPRFGSQTITITTTVDDQATPALNTIKSTADAINAMTAKVTVGVTDDTAAGLGHVNAELAKLQNPPPVKVTADVSQAAAVFHNLITEINGTEARLQLDADPRQAEDSLERMKSIIESTEARMQLDADPRQAEDALRQFVSRANGERATVHVDANTNAAQNAIDALDRQSITLDIHYNADPLPQNARGSIIPARPGGTPVIVGEAGKPEVIAPLDPNLWPRARSLLFAAGLAQRVLAEARGTQQRQSLNAAAANIATHNNTTIVQLAGPTLAGRAGLDLRGVARSSVDGLVTGISEGTRDVGAAFSALGVTGVDELRAALRIKSPSQEMFDIGLASAQGLADGLNAGASLVEEAVSGIESMIVGRLASVSRPEADAGAAGFGAPSAELQARARAAGVHINMDPNELAHALGFAGNWTAGELARALNLFTGYQLDPFGRRVGLADITARELAALILGPEQAQVQAEAWTRSVQAQKTPHQLLQRPAAPSVADWGGIFDPNGSAAATTNAAVNASSTRIASNASRLADQSTYVTNSRSTTVDNSRVNSGNITVNTEVHTAATDPAGVAQYVSARQQAELARLSMGDA